MKFTIALASLGLFATQVAAQCENPVERAEWGSLPRERQEQFAGCVMELVDSGRWAEFNGLHTRMNRAGHGNLNFLVFHRVFLKEVEDALASVGCNFGLPYIDESARYRTVWGDSEVWDVLGPVRGCVENDHLQIEAGGSCVQRACDNRTLHSAVSIQGMVAEAGSFQQLSPELESTQHAQFHMGLGGHMSSLSSAASDPAFFLHHCYVDMVWATWQAADYESRREDIGNLNGGQAVAPFGSYTNAEAADYRGSLCYTYAGLSDSIDVPEDQLEGELEEPPELDEEGLEEFNIDPDQANAAREKLSDLTSKVQDFIKENGIGGVKDIFKDIFNKNKDDADGQTSPDGETDAASGISVSMFTVAVIAIGSLVL